MTVSNGDKALALARLGLYVFPVNPTSKRPVEEDGLKGATNDPEAIKAFWKKWNKAQIGVHAGRSGIVALDIDVERDDEGNLLKDGWAALEDSWEDVPDTWTNETPRGGTHKVYAAPAGKFLTGNSDYRHMKAIDRRGGESYIVWYGDVPTSRDSFKPAPEWLCDEAQVRTADVYEGTLKEWYESLEPGTPNVLVRAAIDRAKKVFKDRGDDLTHSDIVERQMEAVRLGAEGNPGVLELLSVLEELTLDRTGTHSRTPEEYAHEFAEALASGIKKYGDTIALRKDMPEYSLNLIPVQVTDRLVTGEPGGKDTFSELLSQLLRYEDDDYKVLSVLWNAPTVRDLSREWGLEFVYRRVLDSRAKPGTQVAPAVSVAPQPVTALLTPEETKVVLAHPTFIDTYVEAATKAKKFPNHTYDTTAAWSLLSMTLGNSAYIPKGKPIGLNLWFLVLGASGTGKSSSDKFLKDCLDGVLKGGDTYYNLGANSSPEGMHEALLNRDGMPSMIHHDEASDFFDNLKRKDWMVTLKDLLAKWYEGYVDPIQKVRLKEHKGKSARTSMGLYMLATPDRLLSLVDLSMFETGFLARMNWAWAPEPENTDAKYQATLTEVTHIGVDPGVYDIVADLIELRAGMEHHPHSISATPEALKRLVKAHKDMDTIAQGRDRYQATEPAVTRLGRETTWKCAAMLALYRGSNTINLVDALTAIYYVQDWFNTLFRVVNAAGEGDFNRDVNEIEEYVASHPNGVTLPTIYNRFRTMITKSVRDLDDRIQFLVASGRIRRGDEPPLRYFVTER